jgi:hypothetical protein
VIEQAVWILISANELSKKFKRQPKKDTDTFFTATTAPAHCKARQKERKIWSEALQDRSLGML